MRWQECTWCGSKAVALILVALLGSGCAFVNVSLLQPPQPLSEKTIEGEGPGKVVLCDISGVLSLQQRKRVGLLGARESVVARVKEELRKAEGDREVKAVVLRIHSPGGTVVAADILHHEIKGFKQRTGKAVVAMLLGMATSGGYYVATAADYIVASPTTLTGSIGTIAFKFNVSKLMQKVGVEEETIKSGDKKDIWSPWRPATPEERRIFQGIIDGYQKRFFQVIREGRPKVTPADLAAVADGRVLSAEQALELHLVDELGYIGDAVAWARRQAGAPRARVVRYFRPGTYVDNVYSLGPVEPAGWWAQLRPQLPLGDNPMEFMYIWLPH